MKLIDKIKNYHPNKYLLFLYLFLPILIFSFGKNLGLDNDRWFLLNTGKYILNSGIPYTEPFTMHSGLSYVAQQWLFGVIIYGIYHLLGNIGLIVLTIISILIAEYIFYKICNLLNDNRKGLSTILTVTFMILYILSYAVTRPQLIDFIIFLLEFYILEKYIKTKNKKVLLFLPLLSLLLINNHAAVYFMFYAFMLPYILNIKLKYFEYQEYKVKPIIIIAFTSLLISILNPYLLNAHMYIFNSYGIDEINYIVGEMRKPLSNIKNFESIVMLLTIIIPNLLVIFRKKDMKLRYFLLYIGTVYLTISNYKGWSYYLLASIFPLADYLKESFLITKEMKPAKEIKTVCYISTSIIIAISGICLYQNYHNLESEYPVTKITAKLDELTGTKSKDELKIYTDYNIGGYLEWNNYKTYIDPRAESFLKGNNKKEDIFLEYYNLEFGDINISNFIDKYNFDYIIVEAGSRLYNYLTNNDTNYKYIMEEKNKKYKYYLYEKE